MADKRIVDFATLEEAQDDDLLLVSSEDETYNIRIKTLKEMIAGNCVKSVNNVRPRANGDLLLDASDIDTQLPSISYQGGVDGALKSILSMPALPIARGTSADGIAYTATDDASGTVLPTVSVADNANQIDAVGKGRQIVFVPMMTNNTIAPTLNLNDGEIIPIRLRAPTNRGSSDQSPDATLPVPAGALMRGVPYTLTFCGKYWLVDSQITQFTNSIAAALTEYANRLIGLSDADTIAVPIINSMDGVSGDMATMFIRRSAEENATPDADGNVTVPSEPRVLEMINAPTYTTLTRDSAQLTVHCHGLQDGKSYRLHLYTVSRHRGNRQGAWFHPANYDAEPVDGVPEQRIGYGRIAGNQYVNIVFPSVPDWMPNGGYLQTEWDIGADGTVKIDLSSWILPLLKAMDGAWGSLETTEHRYYVVTGIIGVSNRCYAGRLFRFCLISEDTVFPCRDTLSIGGKNFIGHTEEERRPMVLMNRDEMKAKNLYISIR